MGDAERAHRPTRRTNRGQSLIDSGRGDAILAELGEIEEMLAPPVDIESKRARAESGPPPQQDNSEEKPEQRRRGRARKEKPAEGSPKKKSKSPVEPEDREEHPKAANEKPRKGKKQEDEKPGKREKSGPEPQVFEYLNAQNRPYSFVNIFDNLHGKIKKADLQKILDTLSSNGEIVCKEFNKTQIYWALQKSIEVNPETLRAATETFSETKEKVEEAKSIQKTLKAELYAIENSPSTESLQNRLAQISVEMPEIQKRIDKYMQRTFELVDREAVLQKRNELELLEKERKKRIKIFKSMLDMLLEATDMPKKKLLDKIGIEL